MPQNEEREFINKAIIRFVQDLKSCPNYSIWATHILSMLKFFSLTSNDEIEDNIDLLIKELDKFEDNYLASYIKEIFEQIKESRKRGKDSLN